VIHTYVLVPLRQQKRSTCFVKASLLHICRKVCLFVAALPWPHPWNMRIAVERNAVWHQREHLFDGPLNRFDSLEWQTINQIIVHRSVADLSAENRDSLQIFKRLYTVHGVDPKT